MRVGIDLVLISRFENKQKSFFEKNFTNSEIEYASSKQNKAQTYAGMFACKEAFLKAIKKGIFNGIGLAEIEILHNNDGSPKLVLSKKIKKENKIKKCAISISHDGDFAVAICQIN